MLWPSVSAVKCFGCGQGIVFFIVAIFHFSTVDSRSGQAGAVIGLPLKV